MFYIRNIFLLEIVAALTLDFFISSHFKSSELYAEPENSPEQNISEDISSRYKALESFAQGLFFLENMYVEPDKVKQDDLVNNALRGIVEQLDPHTVLLTKKDFEQLTMGTHGQFGGVGIIVSQEEEGLVIVSPIENTPAFKAGIQSGDQIIAIDGEAVASMPSGKAVDMMRGKPGSFLKLQIKRKSQESLLNFNLKREIVKVESVRAYDLTQEIHYVRIASFQENTHQDISNYLQKLSKEKIPSGLILDLRDNPGGLLDQAVKISDLFIESGIIVSTVGRDPKKIEREFATKAGTYSDFPIVVLVNQGSASASEIVAGALQDHNRAVIMGEKTFGKGSVQTLVSLPNGSGLKLTIARYYTPNDRSIQAKGIVPDILLAQKSLTAAPVKPADDQNRQINSEADLKGHIEAKDLSDFANQNGRLEQTVEAWPAEMRQDLQLRTAFSYIKSWNIFEKKTKKKS
ncbi:MAG: S41 family peptidase [Oligoflexales bacterium]|nr:S41 family peptidase [Oligoflexales bacterium]